MSPMSDDSDVDMSPEMSDGRWLSYDQLASLRRIDKPSAVKLATRNRWPRRKNNVGQMQVCVPLHWLERARGRHDKYTATPPNDADKSTDMSRVISALESAVTSLTARAEFAEKWVEQAEIEAKEAQARAIRAESDLAAEQKRAEQAEKTAEAAQIGRAEALQALEELREARAKRAGQGRWARLRLAWRG
jgi:hypothetical protein